MIDSKDKSLPEGWKWAKLGKIAKLYVGSSAPQNKKYFSADGLPFYRVSDVSKYGRTENLIDSVDHISEAAINELKLVSVKAGTIVFPKSGGAVKTNNRAIIEKDGFLVSHLMAVEAHQDVVEKKWLYWYLCQIDLMEYSDNDQYPSLKQSVVEKFEIPLPQLPEQKHIAAILTEQLSAVEKARKASEARLEAARALPAAYLREVFESAETKGWKSVVLDDVCEIQLGKMLSPKSKTGTNSRPYLRNANVQWNRFDLAEIAEMDFDERESEKFALKSGDLLVCEGGEPGRAAIWQDQIIPCYYQKALHRLRPFKNVNPYFILYRLWYGANKSEFAENNAKTTITHLPVVRLEKLPLPLPDIHRQEQLVEILQEQLKAAANLVVSIEAELLNIEKLPAANLRLAFSGVL